MRRISSLMVEIKVRQEYLDLVPAMPKQEFEELKQSIKTNRQYYPITVNKKYEVLDGHHRYKACKDLGLAIDYLPPREFANELDEKEFVINCNLKRRHLNEFQRVEMGKALEGIEGERAKLRKQATHFNTNRGKEAAAKRWMPSTSVEAKGIKKDYTATKTSTEIGKRVNLSHAQYERGKKILDKGTPDQINALRAGDLSIRKVYSQIRREEKRDDLIRQARDRLKIQEPTTIVRDNGHTKTLDFDWSQRCTLYNKDFRQVQIAPDSVDLIVTDPPYTQDQLYLFRDLAQLATSVLKEGGSLVTYAPQYALPQVLNMMNSNMLHYWWMFIVKHTGGRTRMHKYRLWVRYKPLLWFVKGPPDSPPSNMIDDVDDFIVSKPPDEGKSAHDWEQSTVESSYLIQNLSVENQVVLDPFMGTGTTGVSALRLKRLFIGIDINEVHYTTARDRINRQVSPVLVQ